MDDGNRNRDKRAKQREQKRRYRANHRTYRLNFTLKDAQRLEGLAREKGMDVPQYIKTLLSNKNNHTGYILPRDSKLEDLLLAIRRIGNNVNQLTRYCHAHKKVTYDTIRQLKSHLGQIEDAVTQALQYPPKIEDLLKQYLDRNPDRAQTTVDQIKRNYLSHHDH